MLIRDASISLRLATWFSTILFLGWLSFALAMRVDLEHTLTANRYQTLSRRADRLNDLIQRMRGQQDDARNLEFQKFATATGDGLIEIFKEDGTRAFPSPSDDAQSFPWPQIDRHEIFTKVTFRGQGYRVIGRPLLVGSERDFAFLAAPLAGNVALLQRFTYGLLVAVPILLILSAVCGYFVCRQAMAPVDRITALARNISVWNLSDRLPVPHTRDELQRLAETCNQMLGRLDSAVGQIRNFTSNASHELRSPLSFTRTLSEVALLNPKIDSESARTFEEIIQECKKATAVLDDLLMLARADADRGSNRFEPVDLSEIAGEAIESLMESAAVKGHAVRCNLPEKNTAIMKGDSAVLGRLIWILLDNAVKYTPVGGNVDLEIKNDPRVVILRIQDQGIGIAESELPHVFERFYRTDRARDVAEGSGLGLAIAKWIADIHHAQIEVTSGIGTGTRVDVTFPRFMEAEVLTQFAE